MTRYDPYSNQQLTFHRTDPTGRYRPLSEAYRKPHWLPEVIGGAVFGIVVAVMFYFSL